jgi:protease-4
MSLDADMIVDRRRMRRKLTFWRVIAVTVAVVAVVAVAAAMSNRLGLGGAGAYIARVTISGLIRSDQERVQSLEQLGRSASARAVVVHINSPGGTTAGAEQLYDSLSRLRLRKPLVVVVEGLAASGGYVAAMAADHIVAQQTSLVGSIGVLFQYPNVADLLKTIGVSVETVRSSPLKAAPSGYEPTSPEARAAIEAIVKDSYSWFRGMVQERRKLDGEALDRVTDGRVFTGRQGIELKLVDQIGDEKTALNWLAREKNVDTSLPVRDYRLRSRISDLPFLHVAAAALLDAAGLSTLARMFSDGGAFQALERVNLDGLLALWHPQGAN